MALRGPLEVTTRPYETICTLVAGVAQGFLMRVNACGLNVRPRRRPERSEGSLFDFLYDP